MLLVIDNYDSFTFNLVQHLGSLGADPVVVRNDQHSIEELVTMGPTRVVVSPGPCTPSEAGVSIDAFRVLGGQGIPMLGVCLGHQSLGEAFGGRTVRARRIMHGKTGPIRHTGDSLFEGIPTTFAVARYHSLVTEEAVLPTVLEPIAFSADPDDEGEIQAMRHRNLPLWGVQFHPESLFSEHGIRLLGNFLGSQI
ncbi:MAG: aminodeoxychorismate/anthranilate synthase component II [Gemmatimonadetes bacterium]|nr:aminodeoxychorismate/anthranilate synthase component II [Gemmatimonadota bacterium]MDA1103800.1 aminodeoxychorismate/anthranilate synthase component II [Gemmatimonadota bacterium]